MSVGLAGVRAVGRRGHQGGGGVRLKGVGRAGDRAGGPLLIGQADTAQAGQIGQAVTVGGAVLPGSDRGGGGAALSYTVAMVCPGAAVGGCAPLPGRVLFCRWCRAAMPPGVHRGGSTVPPGTVPPGTVPGATVPAGAVPGRAALS